MTEHCDRRITIVNSLHKENVSVQRGRNHRNQSDSNKINPEQRKYIPSKKPSIIRPKSYQESNYTYWQTQKATPRPDKKNYIPSEHSPDNRWPEVYKNFLSTHISNRRPTTPNKIAPTDQANPSIADKRAAQEIFPSALGLCRHQQDPIPSKQTISLAAPLLVYDGYGALWVLPYGAAKKRGATHLAADISDLALAFMFLYFDGYGTYLGMQAERAKQASRAQRLANLFRMEADYHFLADVATALEGLVGHAMFEKLGNELLIKLVDAQTVISENAKDRYILAAKIAGSTRDSGMALARNLFNTAVFVPNANKNHMGALASELTACANTALPVWTLLSAILHSGQGAFELANAKHGSARINRNIYHLQKAVWLGGAVPPLRWQALNEHILQHTAMVKDLIHTTYASGVLRESYAALNLATSIALFALGPLAPLGIILLAGTCGLLSGVGMKNEYGSRKQKELVKQMFAEYRLSQGVLGNRRKTLLNASKEVIRALRDPQKSVREYELARLQSLCLPKALETLLEKEAAQPGSTQVSEDELAQKLAATLCDVFRAPRQSGATTALDKAFGRKNNVNVIQEAITYLAELLQRSSDNTDLLYLAPKKAKERITDRLGLAVEEAPKHGWMHKLSHKEKVQVSAFPAFTKKDFEKYWSTLEFQNYVKARTPIHISPQSLQLEWEQAAAQYHAARERPQRVAEHLLETASGPQIYRHLRSRDSRRREPAAHVLEMLQLDEGASAARIASALQCFRIGKQMRDCIEQCMPVSANSMRQLIRLIQSSGCTPNHVRLIHTDIANALTSLQHTLDWTDAHKERLQRTQNYTELQALLNKLTTDVNLRKNKKRVLKALRDELKGQECFESLLAHTEKVLAAMQTYPSKKKFNSISAPVAEDILRLDFEASRNTSASETTRFNQTMAFARYLGQQGRIHGGPGLWDRIFKWKTWKLTHDGQVLWQDIQTQLAPHAAGPASSCFSAATIAGALSHNDAMVQEFMHDWLQRSHLPNPWAEGDAPELNGDRVERLVAYEQKQGAKALVVDLVGRNPQPHRIAFASQYLATKLRALGWKEPELDALLKVWQHPEADHEALVADINVELGRQDTATPIKRLLSEKAMASVAPHKARLEAFHGITPLNGSQPIGPVPLFNNNNTHPSRRLLRELDQGSAAQRAHAAVMLLQHHNSRATRQLIATRLQTFMGTTLPQQAGLFNRFNASLTTKLAFYGELFRTVNPRQGAHYASLITREIQLLLDYMRQIRDEGEPGLQAAKFTADTDANALLPIDAHCLGWHAGLSELYAGRGNADFREEVKAIVRRQRAFYHLPTPDIHKQSIDDDDIGRMRAWDSLTRRKPTNFMAKIFRPYPESGVFHAYPEVLYAYIRHTASPPVPFATEEERTARRATETDFIRDALLSKRKKSNFHVMTAVEIIKAAVRLERQKYMLEKLRHTLQSLAQSDDGHAQLATLPRSTDDVNPNILSANAGAPRTTVQNVLNKYRDKGPDWAALILALEKDLGQAQRDREIPSSQEDSGNDPFNIVAAHDLDRFAAWGSGTALKSIVDVLNEKGMTQKSVAPDGNCLYHALTVDTTLKPEVARKLVAAQLPTILQRQSKANLAYHFMQALEQSNYDDLTQALRAASLTEVSPQTYAQLINIDGIYSGTLEIEAFFDARREPEKIDYIVEISAGTRNGYRIAYYPQRTDRDYANLTEVQFKKELHAIGRDIRGGRARAVVLIAAHYGAVVNALPLRSL